MCAQYLSVSRLLTGFWSVGSESPQNIWPACCYKLGLRQETLLTCRGKWQRACYCTNTERKSLHRLHQTGIFFFPHHSFLFVTQSELTTCDSLSQAGELMEVPVSLISMPQKWMYSHWVPMKCPISHLFQVKNAEVSFMLHRQTNEVRTWCIHPSLPIIQKHVATQYYHLDAKWTWINSLLPVLNAKRKTCL